MLHLIHWITNYRHEKGYRIDRKEGNNMYTILLFRQPLMVYQEGGMTQMPAGGCIIYEPFAPQFYYSENAAYYHDGIFFDGEMPFDLIRELNLPVNKAFTVSDPEEIISVIRDIADESVRRGPHYVERVDLRIRDLIYALADGMSPSAAPTTSLYRKLADFRMQMLREPEKDWKMSELAEELHISSSYFQHLYRACFHQSPGKELIAARLAMSQYLLRTTSMSVREISEKCGYANVEHFVRQFKAAFGITPKAYQRGEVS